MKPRKPALRIGALLISIVFAASSQTGPHLAQSALAPAQAGKPYSTAMVAYGGQQPYTWELGAPLPEGLQLTPDGGLSGTPKRAGSYSISMMLRDASGSATLHTIPLLVTAPRTAPKPERLVVTNRLGDHAEFVLRAYDGLGGDAGPEAGEWVQQLQAGRITRADFLARLWNTPARRARAAFGIAAYEALLARDPTFAEFRAALRAKLPETDLVASIMDTAEYRAGSGRSSASQQFARALANLAGPDAAARAANQAAGEDNTPERLVALFRDSPPQARNRILAAAAHLWLLQRPPSGAERAMLAAQLDAGTTVADALANLTAQTGFSALYDSTVVQLTEYRPAFRNPLGGVRVDNFRDQVTGNPLTSLARQYIGWNLLENNENDTVDKIRQVTNSLFADLPARNIKAIPRVYLIWPSPLAKYWPADLTPDDYTSDAFRRRMRRLIGRLGEAWNNDPRIGFVEMGIIGWWGEHHHPTFFSSGWTPTTPAEMETEFGDAFRNAFPDKGLMRRYPLNFADYPFGIHWDVFGAPGGGQGNSTSDMTAKLEMPGMIDQWQIAPRGGEIDPTYMNEPDWTLQSRQNVVRKNTPALVETIRRLHWNHVFVLPVLDRLDAEVWDKTSQIQNALGYRFVIDEAAYSPATTPGGGLTVRLKIRNTGSSPLYYPWPLEVSLITPGGRSPVWKSTWDGVDVRSWLPGKTTEILRTFALPESLGYGQYVVALAILDPGGMVPAVRFAVTNYFNGGRTPLGVVALGGTPATYQLNSFDDLQADQSLYYLPPASGSASGTMLQTSPPGYKLLVDGFAITTPLQYLWNANSQHTLSAGSVQDGGTRFVFSSWNDGNTQNPRTVTASATPTTYTANFMAQYLLSKPVTGNGSIEVSVTSADGYYSRGTKVQLRAIPSAGATFTGWGGDLGGTTNPQSITMSAARTVTANFQGSSYSGSGLRFVPVTPCRVMETRAAYNYEGRSGAFGPPSLSAAETRTLNMPQSNGCSIPATAKAYVVNVTVIPAAALGFVTLWPAGDPRPNVWTIRSPDGQIVANSAIVKAGASGGISVYASDRTDLLIDISGYYTDNTAVTGLAFYPLTPCRVIDTRVLYRSPPGPFGPPAMAARETRRFRFPATTYCTVPSAAAYSVTITAVPPAPLAYITAWPDGSSQPNVSSINSFAGRVLANSVIIPASADGTIDVFAYDATDFLVDINGYYAPDDGQNGQFYFPVTPCRASDSTYANETVRTINLSTAAGCSGISANARGYALNFTALPNNNPMPFLTAYPSGQPRPNASVLNAFQGQVVTNSAIVPAGTNGAIEVYAYRATDVVVEVSGYFGR